MGSLRQDIRFTLRKMARSPSFTAVIVLTLALGIGANTAIFSAVHGVLLRALPYPDPDGLVMVWEHNIPRSRTENVVSPANYLAWRDQNAVFEEMSAMFSRGVVLFGADGPQRVQASLVEPSFFQILRASASRGRTFLPEEAVEGNDAVVVLSDGLWRRRFGGDPEILGRSVILEGIEHTVIGVMPPGFDGIRFKPQAAALQADWLGHQDLWVPLALDESDRTSFGRSLVVLARLRPGVTVEAAQAEMETIAARREAEHDFNAGWTVNVVPLHDQVVGETRTALLVLIGAVGFILLIACANVANLLLARVSARRREIAVRSSLGASRRRLVRQLLTESFVFGGLGGGFGLLVALWGIEMLVRTSPGDIPRLEEIGINLPVLAFTGSVALLATFVFGLIPALQASRPDVQASLKEGGRGTTDSAGQRARRALVVLEMAMAVVLLIGAGLTLHSFWALSRVDPGFEAERLLAAQLTVRGGEYDLAGRAEFARALLERTRSLPGVEAAAVTVARPLGGGLAPGTSFWPTDRPTPEPAERPTADIRMVTPDYFRTMGIPLIRGREFDWRDDADAPPVIIISETAARTYWPNEDPIGKQMVVRMGDETPRTIVGVVGDVRHASLQTAPRAKVYYPHAQLSFPWFDLMVRSATDPVALLPLLRQEVLALDPNLPLYSTKRMTEVVAESVAEERFNMMLLSLFALLALTLAAIGIYGVMSFAVSQRTHEIGIRVALGADRRRVLRLVVGQGLALAAGGMAVGLIAAFGLTRLMRSLLFEVSSSDALTFVTVPVLLAATALLACYLPARRAARVDPIVAMRYE